MIKKLKDFYKELGLTFTLVKRDYALQYAGSFLGVFWMLAQNLSLVVVYTFVIFIFQNSSSNKIYPNLLCGLLFWLPLQEMFIKGTTILSENRNLIKRSSLGLEIFLNIPFYQMLIHFAITSIPIFILLAYLSVLNVSLFLLSFVYIFSFGKFVQLALSYLARVNIILKDITPIVRLTSIGFFWTLPIMYDSRNSQILEKINSLNPLNVPLDLFKNIVLENHSLQFNVLGFLPFLIIFLGVQILSKGKFHKIVLDHL
ncbi:MAG: ABC transporter permease [Leptospiraceae bacterium]|nr:ABC transporter permease [Leptospiraceae bacterium]MCK6381635.1 ABC transporter permease [Leptospiraceae bacterium]NUM41305.1 ABC transporter permease [Leptospiraceae bacterium]